MASILINANAQMKIDFVPQESSTIYSVVADATRLGNPAKDFEISFLSCSRKRKHGWMNTQDRRYV